MITFTGVRPFHRLSALGLALLLPSLSAWGQGGSAVITLVMPPPGGDGYTALQSGAALADAPASMYFNPAALGELYRSTGSAFGAGFSRQELLPILDLPDLYQEFWSASLVVPDSAGGTDLGVGVFRNHVSFGKNYDPATGEGSDSWETVWGLALGMRLGPPLSVGLAAKYIDSRLAQGSPSSQGPEDGIARSWAFDAGLLFMPRFTLPEAWHSPITFTPSAALTISNVGPDVFYREALQADPIPRTFTWAVALRADAWDLASITAHAQIDQERTRRYDGESSVVNYGFVSRIVFLELGRGFLIDRSGKRRERFESVSLVLDPVALRRLRGIREYWEGGPRSPPLGMPRWREFLAGIPVRPRLVLGQRDIHSEDNGVREGQRAWFAGISL